MKEYYKHPRLYLKAALKENTILPLEEGQVHYLRTVLRKNVGDLVRVFNGADGEWLCAIQKLEKREGVITAQKCLRVQKTNQSNIHLYFAPIRKHRLDILIEKAVELGVSEFHPVITNRTENRNFNKERLQAQIFEAAEQCERLEIPQLHTPVTLAAALKEGRGFPLYAALERGDAPPLSAQRIEGDAGFLIGPEGGFDEEEMQAILSAAVTPITLGEAVLRAETAAILCLAYCRLR